MERHRRTKEHTHGDRRQAEQGDQCCSCRSQDQGAAEDCEGARPRNSAYRACPFRRGDRMIKRRTVITLLGSTAAAWPLAARAQTGKPPTIGFMGSTTPPVAAQWVASFVQRLREL